MNTGPLDLRQTRARLDPAARAWFDRALTEATATADRAAAGATDGTAPGQDPGPWERHFATAGRHAGHRHADAVRTLLLTAARPDPPTLTRLYHHGTADERRALLLALPYLRHLTPPDAARPLVEAALRTHDTRLIAAAVGPYAARHLDPHTWRHALLTCLFTQVPVDAVADLEHRARGDRELARMLADHADERTAAGRPVPPDLHRVLTLTDEPSEES
ncbi:EboA domain-containing protein [Streptomyces sp. NPDC000594]|uniref:EboA domain-containing protein n=1 Tax=Streptomyces sp. NPDC000594 TaxID=3154261 RepID=UPI003327E957